MTVNSKLWKHYKNALLRGDRAIIQTNREKLENTKNVSEEDFREVDQWHQNCLHRQNETIAAIQSGVLRQTPEFREIEVANSNLGEEFVKFMKPLIDSEYSKIAKKKSPQPNRLTLAPSLIEKTNTTKFNAPQKKAAVSVQQPKTQKKHTNTSAPKRFDVLAANPKANYIKPLLSTSEQKESVIHPNFLGHLDFSPHWTISIDESGSYFSSNSIDKPNHPHIGKFVAIIVPDSVKLPSLGKGFHMVGTSECKKMKIINSICKSPCGVLGITIQSLQPVIGQLWIHGIETLFDLILRLLPMNNSSSMVLLSVEVEERAEYKPIQSDINLKTMCEHALYQFSRIYPHLGNRIEIQSAKFIKKSSTKNVSYADAVANIWDTDKQYYLDYTGWKNTCLLKEKPKTLKEIIDFLGNKQSIPLTDWNLLLDSIDKMETLNCTLSGQMLYKLGLEVQNDIEKWESYLNFVQDHLYSKAINLHLLNKQIEWLLKFSPPEGQITPQERLMWVSTQMAKDNHYGNSEYYHQCRKELDILCKTLYDENAPLTCLAALNAAVAEADNFNFLGISELLTPWLNEKEAVPGRKYFGQVLSSMGQYYAFTGNQNAAVEAFDKALEKFSLLTDKKQGQSEAGQTLAYKVIAMMDSDPVPENMVSTLETYLGMSLTEAAERFSVNADVADKYRHHILLRYLANNPDSQAAKVYLDNQGKWAAADLYHPWELIEFYRGLLISDAEKRNAYFRSGYKIAAAGHGPLQVIAAVILGGIYYSDSSVKEELASLTSSIIESMPYLGKERIKALNAQIAEPIPPLELAKTILPFNFR